jgi:hypothetical protein
VTSFRERHLGRMLPVLLGCLVGLSVVLAPTAVSYVESGGLPSDFYDLQAILAFSNATTALIYNVTATEQPSDCAYGVAYLLNGYTANRDWYQVGLSWNWRGGDPGQFAMNYNVFDSNGDVIDPAVGGGGVIPFSGPIASGNVVRLVLAPSNGSILMNAVDLTTGSTASTSFDSFGQSSFSRGSMDVGRGSIFTGLMTECYRGSSGTAFWENSTYESAFASVPFGALCVDEWNFSNGTYFHGASAIVPQQCTPVLSLSNPIPQTYSQEGLRLWANQTEFAAGSYT